MKNERCGTPGAPISDQFLSEEDLALRECTPEELTQLWDEWFTQAQSTNDFDADDYSHSAFLPPARWGDYGISKTRADNKR